jgi:hypothetical protein
MRWLAAATLAAFAAPAWAASGTCPATTPDAFVKRFMDDAAIQKQFTADPLQAQTIDANAEPEPAPVTQNLPKDRFKFPIMPSTERAAADHLVLKQTPDAKGGFAAELDRPGTDYQVTYRFRAANGCWELYRTEDDSL